MSLLEMTFVEACQRTARNCGISGNEPSTVTNQSGALGFIVDYVRDAWIEIQMSDDRWLFMEKRRDVRVTSNPFNVSAIALTSFHVMT